MLMCLKIKYGSILNFLDSNLLNYFVIKRTFNVEGIYFRKKLQHAYSIQKNNRNIGGKSFYSPNHPNKLLRCLSFYSLISLKRVSFVFVLNKIFSSLLKNFVILVIIQQINVQLAKCF